MVLGIINDEFYVKWRTILKGVGHSLQSIVATR